MNTDSGDTRDFANRSAQTGDAQPRPVHEQAIGPARGTEATRQPRLIAYPRKGIAYCDELYRVVEKLGMQAIDAQWSTRWMLRNVRREDVVHIHWPSFIYFHQGKRLATWLLLTRFLLVLGLIRLKGARIAWTAHNLYPHAGGRSERTHRIARWFVTRVASRIFVHSEAAARLVSTEFGVAPSKITRIPHGHWRALYPNAPSKEEARRIVGLPQDAIVYGFISSCRPYKNLESLVAALPLVDDRSHLLIAGAFSSEEYLQTVRSHIAAGCADRVHIVARFLADTEIMTFVASIDVLVLPYKDILTSGAAMLGLSGGIPVIAPRMGGIPEVINEQCGVLYEPTAPDGLVSAMREVRRHTFARGPIIEHALSFDWSESARALIGLATDARSRQTGIVMTSLKRNRRTRTMELRSAAHRVVDPIRSEYRQLMLRRHIAILQNRLRNGTKPSPALLRRLHHFWSNDAWSAETEFLESMLRWLPKTTGVILECGSGLTTLVLAVATAGTARRVVSLEHDDYWAARVRAALPAGTGSRVDIALTPITSYGEFDWYAVDAVEHLDRVGFVVCDGPPGSTRGGRYGLAPVMKKAFAPGCLVMLDDIARPAERAILARWCSELSADLVEESDRHCVIRVRAP